MQKVLTAAQMREVDRRTTEEYGIPSIILMENAAHAVSRVITEKLGGSVKDKLILILCGPGNNGGDGAALTRVLWEQGANCFAYLLGSSDMSKGDAKANFEVLKQLSNSDEANAPNDNCLFFNELDSEASVYSLLSGGREIDCVVDALLGTGLSRPLEERFLKAVKDVTLLQRHMDRTLFISVDVPSGIDADRAEPIGESVRPNVTVTFTAPKIANVLPPACRSQGEFVLASIGSPPGLLDSQPSELYLSQRRDIRSWLKKSKFTNASYKNKRGHALLIAGSKDYTGAAVLAGDAGIRSGVGLVTLAVPESSRESVVARVVPEVMVRGIAETDEGSAAEAAVDEIKDFLKNVDAIAIGSGMSTNEETAKFIQQMVDSGTMPTVVDADGLTALSPLQKPARGKGTGLSPLILTPHEGEFRKLLGVDKEQADEILKDRVTAVRDFATEKNVILVLKGERVLIGAPDGRVIVNPTGNSGLGKAGNGDTLTGILVGFIAQAVQIKIDMVETVVAACYVAGMAGDIAETKYGKRVMTASDVRECLVEAFKTLEAS